MTVILFRSMTPLPLVLLLLPEDSEGAFILHLARFAIKSLASSALFLLNAPQQEASIDTLRGIIQRMVENIHLSLQIYAMHRASLQQSFVPFPCSIHAFILPLLEHYDFPSPFSCKGWGKKICLGMLPLALPMYQLSHMEMSHTMWLQYLFRKKGRGVALSPLVLHPSA